MRRFTSYIGQQSLLQSKTILTKSTISKKVATGLLLTTAVTAPAFLYYTKSEDNNSNTKSPAKPEADKTETKSNTPSQQDTIKALNGNWREFEIIEITDESHDTKRIKISLWNRHNEFGLPVAGAILIRKPTDTWKDQNKPEMRPYTPVVVNDPEGWVELLVKVYPNGLLSEYIAGKKVGDTLEIKGPLPKLSIKPNMKKNFTMLAGGTGVTPMYQILNKLLEDKDDKTQVHLIISQKTEKDQLLKTEFETLAKKHPEKIHLNVITSDKQGHINKDHLTKLMPCTDGSKCGNDGLIFVCGPPAFYKAYSGEKKSPQDQGELTGLLKEMNFTSDHVYKL